MKTIEIEDLHDGIHRIRLHRPERLNALSVLMAKEITACLTALSKRPALRVVILTGSGEKAFCAGADLKDRVGLTTKQWHAQHGDYDRLGRVLHGYPVPLIAAVNGVAFGGGCELTLACDLVVACEEALFGQPEVRRGIIPGLGGTQFLTRKVGLSRAKELVLTGKIIPAALAEQWGLVNEVVPRATLQDRAKALAREISQNAPLAVRYAKRAIDQGHGLSATRALQVERVQYRKAIATKDRIEGMQAFLEKRPTRFTGK